MSSNRRGVPQDPVSVWKRNCAARALQQYHEDRGPRGNQMNKAVRRDMDKVRKQSGSGY